MVTPSPYLHVGLMALIQRLETDSCRVEDYEVLMRVVEAHTELSAAFLEVSPIEPSLPAPPANRKRQGAKHPRRHHR